jgi:3-oxoadipate enol-lactonase
MTFVEVDGRKIFYEEQGSGKPLVLVHSALTHSGMWDTQMPTLTPHYRVVRYDLYGYGQSAFTVQKKINHVADLKALLAHLGIEKVSIAGVSMGAEMVLDFALAHPQIVEKLILVGAGIEGYEYPADAMAWWNDFISQIKANDFDRAIEVFLDGAIEGVDEKLPTELRARLKAMMQTYNFRHYSDDTLLWAAPASDKPPAARLSEIACPTLVIVGEQDLQVMQDIATFITNGIVGAQKIVVPHAAHLVNMQQPEAFNKIVLEFLQK